MKLVPPSAHFLEIVVEQDLCTVDVHQDPGTDAVHQDPGTVPVQVLDYSKIVIILLPFI